MIDRPSVEKLGLEPIDTYDGLDLFSYKQSISKEHKNIRGVVFNGDDLVSISYGYVEETNDPKKVGDLTNCTMYDSYEGTLVRVFSVDRKWHVSTHRRLDAYSCTWNGTRSYGELFEEGVCLQTKKTLYEFLQSLDYDYQYMFLIRPTKETRNVSDAVDTIDRVLHVGTFHNLESVDMDIDIRQPKKLSILNQEDLKTYLSSQDYRIHQGVMVFYNDGRVVRVYNEEYYKLMNLRDPGVSDIGVRYLQLSNRKDLQTKLLELHPGIDTETYDKMLNTVLDRLYAAYVRRMILKEYYSLPPLEHSFFKKHFMNGTIDDLKTFLLRSRSLKNILFFKE